MAAVRDELVTLDEGKTFRINLKKIMKKKNLTQTELAEKTGLTLVTVGRYFKGTRIPKITTVYKIADALEVTVGELLDE